MLKELRESKGIKISFVADKLKISRDRLRRIECGIVDLPSSFLPFLTQLYNVNYSEIIEWSEKEWKKQKMN